MSLPVSRRGFLSSSVAAGVAAGLGDLAFLQELPLVSATDVKVDPAMVQLNPDMEPLVRLVEETPRDKLLERVAHQVHGGTTYQQLLSALLLAGVRGIKPRPVGFQFHAVLVVHSAHLASLAAPESDRWLPLFWALDNFKASQATNKEKNAGWMMPPVNEGKLPSATQAKRRFIEAMDAWDEEGADVAAAALTRSAGAGEVIELFWRYGCRDFRDIGHKAIFVANSWRALQTVGWRNAEPVVRSLAFALLQHEGDNPQKRSDEPDVPGRENLKRAARIREGWERGTVKPTAAMELLGTLRSGTWEEGAEKVVELLNQQVDPTSLWDGLFLTAGELLMRKPGIGGLHTVTTMNAMHQAYELSGNDETRRLVLLQAASFLPLFRKFIQGRGQLPDIQVQALEKLEVKSNGPAVVEEIFADVKDNPMAAARKVLGCLDAKTATARDLMTAARRLIFLKGRDSHDYKFSSATLEDYFNVSPAWRTRYLASSMFWLKGTGHPDNDLVNRTRAALARG